MNPNEISPQFLDTIPKELQAEYLKKAEDFRNSNIRYFTTILADIAIELWNKDQQAKVDGLPEDELRQELRELEKAVSEQDDIVRKARSVEASISDKIAAVKARLAIINPKKPKAEVITANINANSAGAQTRPLLDSQLKFYQDVFNLTPEVSNLKLPNKQTGFDWLLLVPKGLTPNQVLAKCKERFAKVFSFYDDLDQALSTDKAFNVRDNTDGTYAIYLRNRVEADEELKNLSADDLEAQNKNCITLLERLLLELWYHWQNKKHLDLTNCTLCAGSRDHDGSVPGVCWYGGGLYVSWGRASGRIPYLRARAAVS